jgi:hypothetical protein
MYNEEQQLADLFYKHREWFVVNNQVRPDDLLAERRKAQFLPLFEDFDSHVYYGSTKYKP